MRTLTVALLATLLLVAPFVGAASTRSGTIGAFAPVLGPLEVYSNPAIQNANTITINAGPGSRIVATLTWASTANPVPNDLDMAVSPPSTPPTPLLPPFNLAGAINWALLTADAQIARTTCSNFVAQSHDHVPTQAGVERIDYTVPANGEAGAYRLTINGFLVTVDQPYTLDLAVYDAGGNDVTASAAGATVNTPFVRTSALCQFILPPP